DAINFVYLHEDQVGKNDEGLQAIGRIRGDGSREVSQGDYNLLRVGTGEYLLRMHGIEIDSSLPIDQQIRATLLVSSEGGDSYNFDNAVTYQAEGEYWRIHTTDLGGPGVVPTLQSVGNLEDSFSFAVLGSKAEAKEGTF